VETHGSPFKFVKNVDIDTMDLCMFKKIIHCEKIGFCHIIYDINENQNTINENVTKRRE
jgi:hypothetical protein